jgi:hypothetical protein
VTRECKSLKRTSIRRQRTISVSAKMGRVYCGLKADWWFLKVMISRRKSWMKLISPNSPSEALVLVDQNEEGDSPICIRM